jgi:putative drug exporter of the RND superfamily
VARAVVARPWRVAAGSLALLAIMAAGLAGLRIGLSQTEQFRVRAESVDGLKTLARYFPAGAADPAAVLATSAQADAVLNATRAVPGVSAARVVDRAAGTDGVGIVRVDVTLDAAPGTEASYDAVRALRAAVDPVPGPRVLVGGAVAADLDARTAALRDLRVVVPLVLAVVLLVLVLLLRSLVLPLLLVATVVLSFFASLGASWWAFRRLFDFPALDVGVPLLAFLFLVALGVDYSIFLVTRAREEAIVAARTQDPDAATRSAVVTAVAVTGGVLTSAGILLAAVFAVLGVLPLITLTQLGIIVGFGVLLDTLVVRTVLVPALVALLGRRAWWPGGLPAGGSDPSA